MSETRYTEGALRAAGAIFAHSFPKHQMDEKLAFYFAEIVDRETASLQVSALLGLIREWEETTHDDRPVAVLLKAKAYEVENVLKGFPADNNSPEVRRARGAM